MEQYLEAGRIINTFGIRGEVKLEPWCDSAEFLKPLRRMYIDGKAWKVLSSRVHKGCLIVLFEGVADMNAAMCLKNKIVFFDRADAKLPKGHFFLADIMGAEVVDENGARVGTLTEIVELPGQNVYIVRGETEHSIPAVPEFILETDPVNCRIRVHLIEGM